MSTPIFSTLISSTPISSTPNIDRGYSLEPHQNRARDLCFEQKLRKIKIFHLKITIFTGLTSAVYFNYASGHVIAMLFIANRLPKIKEKKSVSKSEEPVINHRC